MSDKTYRRPIQWASYAQTDKGMVRKVNEDSIITRQEVGLWAVADGLGGHAVGDVASRMVVDSLEQIESKEYLNDMVNVVEDSLIDANSKIFEYSEIMLDKATMGSTVVSLLLQGRVGVCSWAGDSRLYRYRNSEFELLTRDHSQVEEWVQAGLIRPEDSQNHPQANVITRAVGVEETVDIDITLFDAQLGDVYLLCSDGLYNAVSEADIKMAMIENDPQTCVEELINKALANNASDNVSVIVVKGCPGSIDLGSSSTSENM